ncbi:hypothetical protein [Actinotalea sp.]|uniref:hypothetical protein n=1 Tax=Actinotalea sp. TaxID=1872145 RepID=UPI003564617C
MSGAGKTFVLRRGMVGVPNRTVYDERLSYQALGVLTVLLARPDGSPAGYRDLQGRGLGQTALLAALRELDGAGYRHMIRRSGPRGRLVTDVLVSEVAMPAEEAEARLRERLGESRLPVDNSSTVRRNSTHGVTSGNGASSQVAPCGGSPRHGGPRHGEPPHVSKETQSSSSLRSELPQASNARDADTECPHGIEDGLKPTRDGKPRCPLCRRGWVPGTAPWDATNVIPIDNRARQAGDHLEANR